MSTLNQGLEMKFVKKGLGYEKWIVNKSEYCGKLLFFMKGKRCSWHYHELKDEVFYLQSGKMLVKYSYLKSTSSTSGTNNEYTSGVTRSGSSNSGQNGDKLIIDVPSNAPSALWYQCSAHSGMLGKLNIFDSSFS